MNFEEDISQLNEYFFFQEFTYSNMTFRPTPQKEVELADHILWIDDIVVTFQLKERITNNESTPEDEKRWFEKKVLSLATKQIRDTLNYLESHNTIEITNHRGDNFTLDNSKINKKHKVICYLPHDQLPIDCRVKHFHRSRTVGVIHLIQAEDYIGIIQTLLTPAEFADYLEFREELINKWGETVNSVSEQGLMGQYLCGDADTEPSPQFQEYLLSLDDRVNEWDMSGIITQFTTRMTTEGPSTDYYKIVTELAKLKRNELREFKKRFKLSMEKCREGNFVQPYRFASPRTNCGFLFFPLEEALIKGRRQGLSNLTYCCKYDLKLLKCIGVTVAPDGDEWFSVEWCYIEFPWKYNAYMEERLAQSNPFRKVKTAEINRYTYDN